MFNSSYEKIDIERAQRISKISIDILEQYISKEDKRDDAIGRTYTTKQIIYSIKKLCNRHIKNKGEPELINYKHSARMVNNGRLYSVGMSISKMNGKIRGYLCDKYYYDIDMKNAQPTILYYILKNYYPETKFNFIQTYIKNRDSCIQKLIDNNVCKNRREAKDKIIMMMNNDKIYGNSNKFLQNLDIEFKKAQNLLWNIDNDFTKDLIHYKGLNKQNKKGSYLNMVLGCFENKILQETIKEFEPQYISSLIYDGFHISKDIDLSIDEIVKKCNEKTKKYGIEWSNKEFNKELNFIDDMDFDEDEYSYQNVKMKFEEEHFIIKSPLLFGKEFLYEGKKTYSLYNKNDFKTLTETFTYTMITEKGEEIKNKNFFLDWLKDDNKRSYKKLDFSPIIENDNEYYNTFRGFDFDDGKNYIEDKEAIKLFDNHLKFLVDYEEKSFEYLKSYFADIIQNPGKTPGISILLKSPQGYGKDRLLDIIEKMIGIQYTTRTADIKDVLGTFNTAIKDKIFVCINELEGKDGWEYREKLKNNITATHNNINEKGIKHYTQKNNIRYFIFSNRMNPIEISPSDRRFVVFKSNYKKPSTEYFNRLSDMIDCDNSIYTLFNHLKNYKININLRKDRPITKAYTNMRENNVDPVYLFLNDFLKNDINEYFEKEDYKIHKKTQDILIKKNDFMDSYNYYLEQNKLNYLKPTYKSVKSLLNEINIELKPVKINGITLNYYRFKKFDILQQLEGMNIKNEIESFDDDDFE